MTHDELLKELFAAEFHETYQAIRAVAELHKPIQYPTSTGLGDECGICRQEPYYSVNEPYPCLTIQAIEKELVDEH
jgi:hypothetical protein